MLARRGHGLRSVKLVYTGSSSLLKVNHRVGSWTQDTTAPLLGLYFVRYVHLHSALFVRMCPLFRLVCYFGYWICLATEYSLCHIGIYGFRNSCFVHGSYEVCVCEGGGGANVFTFWRTQHGFCEAWHLCKHLKVMYLTQKNQCLSRIRISRLIVFSEINAV
jgi:hypothetical protein